MGFAPLGYRNTRDKNNTPIVAPDKNASFIRWAFEEMATGEFYAGGNTQAAQGKGIICSRNSLNRILRNPVYAGRLFVPAFEDENECFIERQS